MSSRDRPRGPPSSDLPPQRDPRRGGDGRNGGFAGPGDGSLSRAEKFEDEKRRIIHSCFSKKDSDGTLVESYITHVRIIEDAAYPSTPAPPNSPPENKKPRVITVAVRRSGRVRLHKARENNDGSFSIGKTWMLDDLSAIQSYNALVPSTPLEQQQKQWALNLGFVVTVGKPYYWHARTSKEKDFFIGSLIKIYRKYTGGKVPTLIGFDDRERQLLAGPPPTAPPGPQAPHPGPSRSDVTLPPPRPPSSQGSRPQSPYTSRAPSRDGPKRPPAEEHTLRSQKSREQMARPSTGQSAKSGFSPLGPPSHPPPIPLDHREQPPPRATERMGTDYRGPKAPLPPPHESRSRDFPSSLQVTPSAGSLERSNGHNIQIGEISPGVSNLEVRPPSSRDGRPGPESRPAMLRTHDLHTSRSKDGLRPTTPGSAGPRSPLREASERSSRSDIQTEPQELEAPVSSMVGDLPSTLMPGMSAGNKTPTTPQNPEPIAVPVPAPAPAPAPPPAPAPAPPPAPELIIAQPEPPQSQDAAEPAAELEPSMSTTPPDESELVAEDLDAHRPGLGPMVKKKQSKDIAGAFRKAATTYGAFKPRPGGAGERLLAAAKKQKAATDEPDGITSVVPAPFLLRTNSDNTTVGPDSPDKEEAPALPQATEEQPAAPPPITIPVPEPPTVEVTQAPPLEPVVDPVEAPSDTRSTSRSTKQILTDERSRSVSPSPHDRRRRRHEDNTIKYCQSLGINPSILVGRGVEFDDILTDLGWNGRLSDEKRIEDLEADIRREIGRVEATSWLGNLEQQEGKIDQLARLIDKTVEECEELDNLLTLYAHELNTLHDDVAYIETQSQGLQVQTANQKLLQNELQNLLKTLSISSDDLRALKESSLSNPDGLRDTELALSILYKAMLMIDSDIRQNKRRLADSAGDHGSLGVYADTEIGQMRAIQEKKEEYRTHVRVFLQRLKQFMTIAYRIAEQKRIDAVAAAVQKDPLKLNSEARAYCRRELWQYHAVILFAREVSGGEWQALINLYEQQAKAPYQNDFRDNNLSWKKMARKPTGDEQELLFTHQEKEKESEGITMAARKLTVRRGKTIRAAAGLKLSSSDKQTGKLEPCEAFAGTLQETLRMISEEQNFIVHFFHLNSLSTVEFPDLVASGAPDERRVPNFSVKQLHDPDRGMAKKVEQGMDELFSFWPTDMQNLVDWAIQADPLQGIGILLALEKAMSEFDDANQDFIVHSLQKLHSRLLGLFNRFVDEQIRGIEETKVKVNKRKGVISFMRVFPNFATAVENLLSQQSQEFYDIRISVNEAYDRINRAMWESLKFIAKEAPGQPTAATAASGDPEDKEILNYHILLIENMNHYVEEVGIRDLLVLERWHARAQQDMQEHLKLYLDSVIHRPLGKLLEFVESVENLLASGMNPADIASRPSHSRSVAKKVMAAYDGKEVRRGIEGLKKRVEKHFGDADDPGLSRSLVLKVLRECEGRYEEAYDRTRRIIDTVYEGQLELEWRKEEAAAMFQR
ncbi:exocyst complex component Sec3 [Aspergillus uvarum CBS 121591]|uniref:Exocyst complex component Sec3 n=1 Tax=Aspergillus uvarum CBS 121591 TaxID=1448315 RepID=A0A319C431_9EURO|nr:exocyst complex component Sec3 [Aspergillus uvarum CBS 121591]PYH79894.1 exocyst complex component Sec3 [Aspergillus uvarum CBS 121591]